MCPFLPRMPLVGPPGLLEVTFFAGGLGGERVEGLNPCLSGSFAFSICGSFGWAGHRAGPLTDCDLLNTFQHRQRGPTRLVQGCWVCRPENMHPRANNKLTLSTPNRDHKDIEYSERSHEVLIQGTCDLGIHASTEVILGCSAWF